MPQQDNLPGVLLLGAVSLWCLIYGALRSYIAREILQSDWLFFLLAGILFAATCCVGVSAEPAQTPRLRGQHWPEDTNYVG